MRVLVAIEPAELRKGIDGLARLAQERREADPFCGRMFVVPTLAPLWRR